MGNIHVKLYKIWTRGSGDGLKTFLIWSFVQLSVTICVILEEGFKRNNCYFFFKFGSVVQEMSFKRFLIRSSGDSPVQ